MKRTGPRVGKRLYFDEPGTVICVTVPNSLYDSLFQLSQRSGLSIPEVIRRKLKNISQPMAQTSAQ